MFTLRCLICHWQVEVWYITKNGNSNVVNPLYMSRLAAPNLEWEKTKAWNIGLDFSFLEWKTYC